jgi:hypothetical protein
MLTLLTAFLAVRESDEVAVFFRNLQYCHLHSHSYSLLFHMCHCVNIYSNRLRGRFCNLSLYMLYILYLQQILKKRIRGSDEWKEFVVIVFMWLNSKRSLVRYDTAVLEVNLPIKDKTDTSNISYGGRR